MSAIDAAKRAAQTAKKKKEEEERRRQQAAQNRKSTDTAANSGKPVTQSQPKQTASAKAQTKPVYYRSKDDAKPVYKNPAKQQQAKPVYYSKDNAKPVTAAQHTQRKQTGNFTQTVGGVLNNIGKKAESKPVRYSRDNAAPVYSAQRQKEIDTENRLQSRVAHTAKYYRKRNDIAEAVKAEDIQAAINQSQLDDRRRTPHSFSIDKDGKWYLDGRPMTQEALDKVLPFGLSAENQDVRKTLEAAGYKLNTYLYQTDEDKKKEQDERNWIYRNWDKNAAYESGDVADTDLYRLARNRDLYNAAKAAGDKDAAARYHEANEAIRAKYGYSGGAAGDQQIRGDVTLNEYAALNREGSAALSVARLKKQNAVTEEEIAAAEREEKRILENPAYQKDAENKQVIRDLTKGAALQGIGNTGVEIGALKDMAKYAGAEGTYDAVTGLWDQVGKLYDKLDAETDEKKREQIQQQINWTVARAEAMSAEQETWAVDPVSPYFDSTVAERLGMPTERQKTKWDEWAEKGDQLIAGAEEGMNGGEKFVADLYANMIQMAPTTAAALIPGAGGVSVGAKLWNAARGAAQATALTQMAVSAGGGRYRELVERGIPYEQARTDSLISAAIEWGTESVPLHYLGKIASGTQKIGKTALGALGTAMATEGTEEGISYAANSLWSWMRGYKEDQFQWSEMGSNILSGAIMGGLHAGFGIGVNRLTTSLRASGNAEQADELGSHATKIMLTMAGENAARQKMEAGEITAEEYQQIQAQMYANLLDNVKNVRDYLQANQESMTEDQRDQARAVLAMMEQAQEQFRSGNNMAKGTTATSEADSLAQVFADGMARNQAAMAAQEQALRVSAPMPLNILNTTTETLASASPVEQAKQMTQQALQATDREMERRKAAEQIPAETPPVTWERSGFPPTSIIGAAIDARRESKARAKAQAKVQSDREAVRQNMQTQQTAPASISGIAETMGENGARGLTALTQRTQNSQDVGDYIRVYNRARTGSTSNPRPKDMPVSLYREARDAGRRDRAAEMGWSMDAGIDWNDPYVQKMDKKVAREVDAYAKALGTPVRFVDPGTAELRTPKGNAGRGTIIGNEIFVNKNSKDPVRDIVGHEFLHRIRDLGGDAYQAFEDYVMSIPAWEAAVRETLEEYAAEGVKLSEDLVREEVTAKFAGDLYRNTEQLQEFIRRNYENRTLLERVLDFFRNLRDALTGRDRTQADEAVRLLEEALEVSAERVAAMEMAVQQATNAAEAEQYGRYSLVTDQKTLDFLENQEHVTVYRAMQVIDGKLYPPMAAKVAEEAGKGKKRKLVEETKLNTWYQSDERPELATDDGFFILDKGNGKAIKARYNPYFHTSTSPLNDQFSSAYDRPNLVTVECEIPVSELTSGYQAEKAKDPVGETKWHAGPVASKLKGDKARRVFLSRWAKVNRIVPDAEVARVIAKTLEGEDVAVPQNVVTPSLYSELKKQGVKTEDMTGEKTRFSLSSPVEETAEKAGVQIDAETESAAPVRYSFGSWSRSEYVQNRDETAKVLAKRLKISQKKAKGFIDSVNSVAKMIAEDRERLDYRASPGRSPFVSNAEYGGSIDFSTICKKRRLFTGTIDAIQRAMPDRVLTSDEMLKIRAEMKKRGYEVGCGLCYVEGSRVRIGKYTKEFLDGLKAEGAEYVPTLEEMNTVEGQEGIRLNHPETYEKYVKFMNKLAQRKPKLFQMATEYNREILDAFEGKEDSVKEKNKNGGLRLQSFSDFEIIHLIDCMQVIMDMSRVGLAGQAYTKQPEFAWALGETGLKINLSLIAKGVDENGKLIFDDVEGMPIKDAMALRDRYSKNVGTILVTFNMEQLKAAMADDRIDFIIPFHRSQWNQKQYALMGLPAKVKDMTYWQNERYIKPVYGKKKDGSPKRLRAKNYMPNQYWDFSKDGKWNAEEYLKMCAENNKRPKFWNLLVDNKDGSYSLQPDGSTDGYWKLLIDFKMYDNEGKGSPQKPVRPDFNMDESRKMLDEYNGGHEKFPVAQDIVDEFVEGARFSIGTSDVEILRSIGRKSVNDFTSDEIQKAEPWARKFWQEIGVKSPFFRAWFGDWRENSIEPVSMPEIDMNATPTSGNAVNKDTDRKMSWDKNTARESILNASKDSKRDIQIIAANMGPVVEKAILLGTEVSQPDSKRKLPGTAFMHNFYTVAPVEGKHILVKLYAEEAYSSKQNTVFTRAYSLKYIEKVADIDYGVRPEKGLSSSQSATINSVADLFALVKQYDPDFQPKPASKIVDEDGKPLLVYHGTDQDFTVFDKTKGRSNMDIQGMFFSPWELDAEGYGGNVGAYYLNIKNPADERTGYRALNKFKGQNGAGVKARKYLESLGYDGVNNGNEEFIAFDSEQIKSATDNIGTFDRANPDTRFSLPASNNDAIRLMRENQLLREKLDYWKSQVRRSDRTKAEPKEVKKLANKLAKDFSTAMGTGDISDRLQAIYDGIGKDWSYEQAYEEAGKLAREMIEQASETEDYLYNEYEPMRQFFRDQALVVTDEMKRAIPDYNEWRKSRFGKLRLQSGSQTNVDRVFLEAAQLWPEWFDETVSNNSLDQLERIAEMMDGIYRRDEVNPFEGDMATPVGYLAVEIMDRFWDMPVIKKTFADRAEARLVRQMGKTEAAKERGKERLQTERERGNARVQAERAKGLERVQVIREQRDREIAKLRAQNRERYDNALRKAREQREKALRKQSEQYLASKKRSREKQKERELRAKIQRHVNKLSTKVTRPTDTQHIPAELQKPVAAALESINLASKNEKQTKRTEAFHALQKVYRDILENGGDIVVDPALLWQIDKILDYKDTPIMNLGMDALQTIWDTVKAIEASISTYNKALGKAKFATISDAAFGIRDYLSGRKDRGDFRGPFRAMDKLLNFGMLTPEEYFSRMGMSGTDIFKMLRAAQDEHITIMRDAQQAVRDMVKGSTVKRLEKETHTFDFDGQTVTLTTAQIMSLYELMKRQQAIDHIMVGGVKPEIVKGVVKNRTPSEPWNLTQDQIGEIVGTLTENQVKLADDLQKYMGTVMAELGNKASMEVYGYRKFNEKNYFPIAVDKNETRTDVKNDAISGTIAGWGSAKPVTPNANNALILRSVFDVFADHTTEMANYAAWLAPMENLNRILNFRFKDENGNLKGGTKRLLERAFGKNGAEYWKKLQNDLNNGVLGTNDNPFQTFIGAYKGSSIGANLRVMAQQPTAILRALNDINPADFIAGVALTRPTKYNRVVKKYAPIATWKSWGYFTADTGRQMRNVLFNDDSGLSRMNEALMAGAGAMDSIAWSHVWNALEVETRRKRKDLKPGTEEFYQAVAERFNDVIDRTQVVDGILQRSQIMRSADTLTKIATSFMAEPTKVYNMFVSDIYDVRNATGKQRTAAMGRLAKTSLALAISFVANAAAQSLIDALRDDDKDEKYWEKFLRAYFGGEGETRGEKLKDAILNGNLGSAFNPANYIPFVKDFVSMAQGYKISRMDMDAFQKIFNEIENYRKAMDGESKMTKKNATLRLTSELARLLGVPAANLKRDIMAGMQTFFNETDNYRMLYEMETFLYDVSNSKNLGEFCKLLLAAERSGDTESFNAIRQDMINSGVDAEKLDKKLSDLRKKAVTDTEEYQTAVEKKTDAYATMLANDETYQSMPAEDRENAQSNLGSYAEWESYGGQVELGVQNQATFDAMQAANAAGINPVQYVVLKTAVGDIHNATTASGETIDKSASYLKREKIEATGYDLSGDALEYAYDMLNVAQNVREMPEAEFQKKLAEIHAKEREGA